MYTKHKPIERMECKTTRKQYDKEFKIHAAKLVVQTGKAVEQVARELVNFRQALTYVKNNRISMCYNGGIK